MNEKNVKFVKNLCDIKSAGDHCVIITRIESAETEYWQLDLCNSLGSPIDTKYLNIEPVASSMSKTHVVVCSHDHIYLW